MIIEKYVKNIDGKKFYICGSAEMNKNAAKILKEIGVKKKISFLKTFSGNQNIIFCLVFVDNYLNCEIVC